MRDWFCNFPHSIFSSIDISSPASVFQRNNIIIQRSSKHLDPNINIKFNTLFIIPNKPYYYYYYAHTPEQSGWYMASSKLMSSINSDLITRKSSTNSSSSISNKNSNTFQMSDNQLPQSQPLQTTLLDATAAAAVTRQDSGLFVFFSHVSICY